MILAMEGVRGAVVLLNGPMGCRFYHSTTSQFLSVRPLLYVPSGESGKKVPVDYNYLNDWFFRQPRVPCTYLDGYDYVYGTRPKVREALHFLKENIEFDLITIVNSPGATLIGDNLKELVDEEMPDTLCVMLESPGLSEDFSTGYEAAVLALLQQVLPKLREKCKEEKEVQARRKREDEAHRPCLNVLGLSIFDRYAPGDRDELRRIFASMGISVSCFLADDCTPEELAAVPDADLNLVISPERGLRTAQYLKERYGTDFLIPECPPVGFEATEAVIRAAAGRLNVRAEAALEECGRGRALAWYHINNIFQAYGKPNGVRYAVEAPLSWLYAFSRFFTDYLGMIPDRLVSSGPPDAVSEDRLRKFLEEHHCGQALGDSILDTGAELVFSNANTIAQLKAENKRFCGIEISLPGMGYTDIIPKTQIGIRGALFLTEQVLNGLMNNL